MSASVPAAPIHCPALSTDRNKCPDPGAREMQDTVNFMNFTSTAERPAAVQRAPGKHAG